MVQLKHCRGESAWQMDLRGLMRRHRRRHRDHYLCAHPERLRCGSAGRVRAGQGDPPRWFGFAEWRVIKFLRTMLTKKQNRIIMNTKSIFTSKTAILNTIAALSMIYPPAAAVVSTNPELTVSVLTLANFILRMVTSKRIQLF